ncbi:hypothetical protein E3A20_18360, partial [Planctomyces bekefii]
ITDQQTLSGGRNEVLFPGVFQLLDFELAVKAERDRAESTAISELEGTLAYISPEQTGRTNRRIDSRTDLFAVGVVLYKMLSGKLPFFGADDSEMVHKILTASPPSLDGFGKFPSVVVEIVNLLLEKSAENRYASALGLAHDLSKFCVHAAGGIEHLSHKETLRSQ